MDPVLIVIIAVAAAYSAYKFTPTLIASAIFKLDKKSDTNKVLKEKQKKFKEAKKRAKAQMKVKQISQSMTRIQDVLFKNTRTKREEKLRVSEIAKFDDNKDVLLKGRLHIVDSAGRKTVQDIYLFQPRVSCGQTQIGPKLNKFGNLSDEHTYLCRRSGNEDILSGYVPKREVLSGMRFDYVRNGKRSFIERNPLYNDYSKRDIQTISGIEDYIHIDIPKDNNGNFIPVDLKDINQLKEFQTYVKRHYLNFKNNKIRPEDYFKKEFEKAQRSLVKHIEDYEPTYIPVASKVEPEETETIKVESSKKAETSINDYYQRFNYYLDPRFGEKYNTYNGAFGPSHPPRPPRHR